MTITATIIRIISTNIPIPRNKNILPSPLNPLKIPSTGDILSTSAVFFTSNNFDIYPAIFVATFCYNSAISSDFTVYVTFVISDPLAPNTFISALASTYIYNSYITLTEKF